jgi:hypothetical protein
MLSAPALGAPILPIVSTHPQQIYEGIKRKLDLVESNGKTMVVLSSHTGYVSDNTILMCLNHIK